MSRVESEITTSLARDLAADFGQPSAPTGASEMARLTALEGRVKAVVDELKRLRDDRQKQVRCELKGRNRPNTVGYYSGGQDAYNDAAFLLTRTLAGGGDDGETT